MNDTNSSITVTISGALKFTGSITIPGHELKAIFETAAKEALIQNLSPQPPAQPQETIVPKKLMYKVQDVAQLLSMCPKSVHRLLQRGLLKASLASRHKLIPATSIEKFIKNSV